MMKLTAWRNSSPQNIEMITDHYFDCLSLPLKSKGSGLSLFCKDGIECCVYSILISQIQFWLTLIIRFHCECEGGTEKFVLRITHWHYEACRVVTIGDPLDGFFYPRLTRFMRGFFPTILGQ